MGSAEDPGGRVREVAMVWGGGREVGGGGEGVEGRSGREGWEEVETGYGTVSAEIFGEAKLEGCTVHKGL